MQCSRSSPLESRKTAVARKTEVRRSPQNGSAWYGHRAVVARRWPPLQLGARPLSKGAALMHLSVKESRNGLGACVCCRPTRLPHGMPNLPGSMRVAPLPGGPEELRVGRAARATGPAAIESLVFSPTELSEALPSAWSDAFLVKPPPASWVFRIVALGRACHASRTFGLI